MKKLFALIAIVAFIGVSAFSLDSSEKDNSATEKKTECATVASDNNCGTSANAVLTGGIEKGSECSSSAKAVKTAAGDCGSAVNAVLAGGSASDCSSSAKAAQAAEEKAAGCCSSAVSADGVAVPDECDSGKTDKTGLAGNQ